MQVQIYDTTLRDGMQGEGMSLSAAEKVRVAHRLDELGVDLVEAGFPSSNPKELELFSLLERETFDHAQIAAFGMTRRRDAGASDDAGLRLLADCFAPVCTLVGKTWSLHLEKVVHVDREENLRMIAESVGFLVEQGKRVVYDAEHFFDGWRDDRDYALACLRAAAEAGAETVVPCDTNGGSLPPAIDEAMRDVVAELGSSGVQLGIHCHNDAECGVANSLAGVRAGARQIECTVNGIGERAGNASLEEVVMAMKVRNDVLPFWTGVDATMLTRASKLISAATSFPVQYNKAIVGRNAFAHESGIHQDGMLKHTQTYEIMTPESVGVKQTSLVMGKHSGRHAFVHKLKELGYELAANQLEDAFVRFKTLADRKKHVYDEDIEALVDEEIATAQDRIKLVSLSVIAGTRGPQRATMKLDIEGKTMIEECDGNGPVDATFNCIKALVPHEATLELYQVHAVTEGTDAQAEVSVRLAESGRSVSAKGADPDTLVASAKAYLGALNKLIIRRQRGNLEALVVAERRTHSTEVV